MCIVECHWASPAFHCSIEETGVELKMFKHLHRNEPAAIVLERILSDPRIRERVGLAQIETVQQKVPAREGNREGRVLIDRPAPVGIAAVTGHRDAFPRR